MATTLTEMATFIASAVSMTVGTDFFMGYLPSGQTLCGSIQEYPGAAPDYVMGQALPQAERPRLQIAFRGEPKDYETPRAKAELAYQACAQAANTTLGSTRYLSILPLQPPFKIRTDANQCPIVGFNVAPEKAVTS
jgi:hypothetical protein